MAELSLDGGVHQHAVHVRKRRSQFQQADNIRAPARCIHAFAVWRDKARQLDRLAPCRRKAWPGLHIEADIDIKPGLVTKVAARQRPAARGGNVFHIKVGQTRSMCLTPELFDPDDRFRRPPEAAARLVDSLVTHARVGQARGPGDAAAGGGAADDAQGTRRGRSRDDRQREKGDQEPAETGQNRRSKIVMTSPGWTKLCRVALPSIAVPPMVRTIEP